MVGERGVCFMREQELIAGVVVNFSNVMDSVLTEIRDDLDFYRLNISLHRYALRLRRLETWCYYMIGRG